MRAEKVKKQSPTGQLSSQMQLSEEAMDTLVIALRAAAEPTRLRIIALLSKGELTVSDLVTTLGQSQPRISRHLKLLAEARLLTRHRKGSWVLYRLADFAAFDSSHPGVNLVRHLILLLSETEVEMHDLERLTAIKFAKEEKASVYTNNNADKWDSSEIFHVNDKDIEAIIIQWLGQANMSSLLDIGTGKGRILEILSAHSKQSIGIDSSREMLAIARSNLEEAGCTNCKVRQADLYRLPFNDTSFDTAVIHQVLHFLDDPEAAIKEASRVINPGGRLLVVDFYPHLLERLRSEQNHCHLGFLEEDIFTWFRQAELIPVNTKSLAGTSLTVGMWMGKKSRQNHE